MNDKVGKLPKITDAAHALREIVSIAKDKRGHVMLDDHCKWLELKLKTIGVIASKGLKA